MAHFIEHMMFKGTSQRSAQQIAREIDALGGVLNAQTSKEYTVYYTKVLDEHLAPASEVLFDLFLNSEFSPEELEKEKQVVLQEIRMTEDTPDDYITDLYARAYFRNSPLGEPILGSMDSVGSIGRDDILRFIEQAYDPHSVVVVGVGNLEHQRLVDLTGPLFEGLIPRARSPKAGDAGDFGGAREIFSKDLEQVHFTLGTRGPAMEQDQRWDYIVLNNILGGSMSSLLFQEVREKLGLVYSIYSYLSAYSDCGTLAVYAGTNPENAVKTLEVICEQMRRLKKGDLGGIRLEEVKTQLKGNLLLSRENTESRMASNAKNELYFGRDVPVEEVLSHIDAVSQGDVIALARQIFDDSCMTLVALGRTAQNETALTLDSIND